MATYITTLQDKDGSNGLLPKTVLKAIADDNGNYLDNQLTANDLNFLKNGGLSSFLVTEEITSDEFNVSANSSASGTKTVSKTGYIPIGIVGCWVSTGALQFVEYFFNTEYTWRIDFTVRNTTSSALSNKTVRFTVLFMKDIS